MKDGNFEKGPKNFFKRAPALIRPLVIWKVRGKVRRNLHAHGIGRHNEAEMTAMSDRAFEALSQLLGDNPYLMGSRACGADATAFAFIAGSLCPLFDSPAHAKARALPNLIAYRDRMMSEFYPGFEKGAAPIS
jgi:glutathione S-transferase